MIQMLSLLSIMYLDMYRKLFSSLLISFVSVIEFLSVLAYWMKGRVKLNRAFESKCSLSKLLRRQQICYVKEMVSIKTWSVWLRGVQVTLCHTDGCLRCCGLRAGSRSEVGNGFVQWSVCFLLTLLMKQKAVYLLVNT